jgi:hypothetical protein|tara:strand:- start:135 stop:482 length:348 start_codon:yes stop_codon:yes gene_type:complete
MTGAANAIDRRARPVTHKRNAAGAYDQTEGSPTFGQWIEGSETTTTIQAVVQPASGRQLMDLPEGIRDEARWIIWSRAEMRNDDVIVNAGSSYRVMYLWPRAEGEFYRAAMGLLA